jgi:hypothetical protein
VLRLLVYLLLLGAVLYAVFWAIDRRQQGPKPGPRTRTPRGPVGPDDDDDFLRDLERRRRRNQPPPSDDSSG